MFFFCCGPAQTLTHSLWAGAISARFGWCFFFCCGPARSFLVSLKRPGGAAAKKNPRGGVFFLLRPRADAHSLTAGLGGASPSPGWCFFFFAAAPPGPGWCFFFCCGPARTGVVLFFLLRPRADAHSLTAGLGGASPSPGWCFFFLLRPRPDRGGVFFFAVAPPGRSLTHCGLGRFRQGSGGVFFFCCGPARSFLDSLKRPGGAAAKKKNTGRCFFAAAPRGRSLTHCGPGWCLPLAGVVFFFLLRPRPDRGGVFFFAVAPPGRSLTHCGLGRFRQGSGGVFFFAVAPPGLFWLV